MLTTSAAIHLVYLGATVTALAGIVVLGTMAVEIIKRKTTTPA